MKSRQKLLFFSLVFCITCLASTTIARADSVTSNNILVTAGVFGPGTNDNVVAGTFTFLIPAGHTVTGANLVGFAAHFLPDAQTGLVLDGNVVVNLSGITANTSLDQPLDPSLFTTLEDGSSVFSLNRFGGTSGGAYGLFSMQLQITTAETRAAPVPEASSMALLGTGLLSLAGVAWRRRRAVTIDR